MVAALAADPVENPRTRDSLFAVTEPVPLTIEPLPVKLRVEDYLTLDHGAFDAYGKTDLIEGEVFYINAQHRPHARIKSRLFRLLADVLDDLGSGLEALVEGSIAVLPHNVPEPDIALTAEPEGKGLIPLASLALVIEVSDATVRNDFGRKRIYARDRIPEYWWSISTVRSSTRCGRPPRKPIPNTAKSLSARRSTPRRSRG